MLNMKILLKTSFIDDQLLLYYGFGPNEIDSPLELFCGGTRTRQEGIFGRYDIVLDLNEYNKAFYIWFCWPESWGEYSSDIMTVADTIPRVQAAFYDYDRLVHENHTYIVYRSVNKLTAYHLQLRL